MNRLMNLLLRHRFYPVGSSLFIIAFLLIFLPFDINRTKTETLIVDLAIIGFIHSLLLYGYRIIISHTKLSLKLREEFFLLIPFFLVTALLTMLTHSLLGFSSLSFKLALEWTYSSLLILSIPHMLVLFGFKKSIFFQREDYVFQGISMHEIFYMHALGNYVEVIYNEDQVVKKKIIRCTLSSLEHMLNFQFIRCHRSYIINSEHHIKLKGNARSYKVSMDINGETTEIPVSTKRREVLLRHFN